MKPDKMANESLHRLPWQHPIVTQNRNTIAHVAIGSYSKHFNHEDKLLVKFATRNSHDIQRVCTRVLRFSPKISQTYIFCKKIFSKLWKRD